jgi:hypothetical protein
MHVRSSGLALAVGALLVLGADLASAKEPQYVGAKKCKSCHKKELMGNQYGERRSQRRRGSPGRPTSRRTA